MLRKVLRTCINWPPAQLQNSILSLFCYEVKPRIVRHVHSLTRNQLGFGSCTAGYRFTLNPLHLSMTASCTTWALLSFMQADRTFKTAQDATYLFQSVFLCPFNDPQKHAVIYPDSIDDANLTYRYISVELIEYFIRVEESKSQQMFCLTRFICAKSFRQSLVTSSVLFI